MVSPGNPPEDGAADGAASERHATSRPRLRGWRLWAARIALIFLAPTLVFGLLEIGLRLGGYGYPTGFFVRDNEVGDWKTNMKFAWRFFPREIARTPQPSLLEASKPAGTCRVFVLGSSAALGMPDTSFNLARVLEVMLRERYPGVRFEVVPAALTAVNSNAVLPMARDCAALEPDAFVIYMGNNEVVGPYGPATVFAAYTPNLAVIRASLWLKSMRLGQAMGDLARRVAPPKSEKWLGMEMFQSNLVAADDPRLSATYDHYRANLEDICRAGRRAGAAVILSTVAVNLKDCPPFASLHRADLADDDLNRWESAYRTGTEYEAAGRPAEAVEGYRRALAIDDRHADLRFRLARCLAATGRWDEARTHYVAARDLDALRFRADGPINEIVRTVAERLRDEGVRLVDAERLFGEALPAARGAPGEELFYEHVHMRFAGTWRLARAVLEQVEAAGLPALRAQPPPAGLPPSAEACARRLALTPYNEHIMADQMAQLTALPPFTRQLEHAERQRRAEASVAALRQSLTPQVLDQCVATYREALRLDPHFARAYMILGNVLSDQRRFAEAIPEYEEALRLWYDDEATHNNLAAALVKVGRLDDAIHHLEEALRLAPDALSHCNLAIALMKQGRKTEAVEHCRQALLLSPDAALAARIHQMLDALLVGEPAK